jgi:hypothetical protein
MMGGGFITASAPILMTSFGTSTTYAVGFLSIVAALLIAYFSGWMHKKEQ